MHPREAKRSAFSCRKIFCKAPFFRSFSCFLISLPSRLFQPSFPLLAVALFSSPSTPALSLGHFQFLFQQPPLTLSSLSLGSLPQLSFFPLSHTLSRLQFSLFLQPPPSRHQKALSRFSLSETLRSLSVFSLYPHSRLPLISSASPRSIYSLSFYMHRISLEPSINGAAAFIFPG